MLFKVLGIALAISILANVGLGFLYKGALKEIGGLEVAIKANKERYESALAIQRETINALEAAREADQALVLAMGVENARIQAQVDATAARLDKMRTSIKSRTLKKPEVTRRAARAALSRDACRLWRVTGGVGRCPR